VAIQRVKQAHALAIVYGATVVRIDKAEIPQVSSLINIGNAGNGQLQCRLYETIVNAESRNPLLKGKERR
jgi:hypothetical protein